LATGPIGAYSQGVYRDVEDDDEPQRRHHETPHKVASEALERTVIAEPAVDAKREGRNG
jgi:hypothetical protein